MDTPPIIWKNQAIVSIFKGLKNILPGVYLIPQYSAARIAGSPLTATSQIRPYPSQYPLRRHANNDAS